MIDNVLSILILTIGIELLILSNSAPRVTWYGDVKICQSGTSQKLQSLILSQGDIECAQKSVTNAVSAAEEKSQSHGKYNSYSKEQRAVIGKYAAENGPTNAAKHYTAVWGMKINESTARRLKKEYLEKLKEEISENRKKQADASDTEEHKDEPIVISELETKRRGRPVCLGEQLDSLVQEFLINLRAVGRVVNTTVGMGASCRRNYFLS